MRSHHLTSPTQQRTAKKRYEKRTNPNGEVRLYIVQNLRSGNVKIGVCCYLDLRDRLRGIQNGNEDLCALSWGSEWVPRRVGYDIERDVQQQLKPVLIRNSWYEMTPDAATATFLRHLERWRESLLPMLAHA